MNAFPVEFIREIEEMLGGDSPAFFASMERRAALAMRINPLKSGAWDAAKMYVESAVPWAENGFYLLPDVKPGASIAHAAGAFYLQEASAMVSAAALNPRSDENILDLCAAPGGKSTQLAAMTRGGGLLICNEPEPARAKVLAANLERMGVRNACVTCAYPDALAKKWRGFFDAILCDAPCSGEGMFRRDPNARSEWTSASPAGCAKRQADILDSAAELLRPGGRLIYSTCTFNRVENEGTIAAFLRRRPDFAPEDFALNGVGASEGGLLRVLPHLHRGDGHFCARLRKAGSEASARIPASKPDRESLRLIAQFEQEICALPDSMKRRVERSGDTLICVPENCPDLTGLRVISRGVPLFRVGKNYFEPAHPLAMAIPPERARQRFALTDGLARRYLAGEALPCDESRRGWTLIVWQNLPLGWGKASNGQMKNHLPKGLRINLHEN